MSGRLSLILLPCLCFGQSPSPHSGREAVEFVHNRRGEARKLFTSGDNKGIEKGIQISQEVLTYLDQPVIHNLAAGDRTLAAQRSSVFFDLAEAYALQGKDRECLDSLRQVVNLAPSPRVAKFLESSRSLKRLQGNREFNDILRQLREFEYFWDSPALNTPFRDNLPDAEKLAGLSKFWAEVKYSFGFPDKLLAVNWDKLYLDWIPRILATQSTEAYYRELRALCARLRDGHTAVLPPAQVDPHAKPPLHTRLIEGHIMILDVMSPGLQAQGVRPGMEITAVNGEPTIAYAKREIEPYQSASTSQDLEMRTYSNAFLRGSPAQTVRLGLRDSSGNEFEKEVGRSGHKDVREQPIFEWRMLPGGIAYVALNGFAQERVVKEFQEAFPKINESSALIIDLRRNGGGNSSNGFAILQYLLLEPALSQRQIMRSYNPTFRAREGLVIETIEQPPFSIKPREDRLYRNPIAVLIGSATYSAAEDFLVVWRTSGRGKMIGEPSGGSTGQPVSIQLPGGGSARICST